jgi:hypothetical protein
MVAKLLLTDPQPSIRGPLAFDLISQPMPKWRHFVFGLSGAHRSDGARLSGRHSF